MGERCEVLVTGTAADTAAAAAADLRRHGVDVLLTTPEIRVGRRLPQSYEGGRAPGRIGVELLGRGERTEVATSYLITADGADAGGAGGREFSIGDAEDGRNLSWKLAAVLRGAGSDLLDTYLIERGGAGNGAAGGSGGYAGSPLSQSLGGKRVRLRPGEPVPPVRLWSLAAAAEVTLPGLATGPHWTLLGIGSVTEAAVADVSGRFAGGVRGYVVGGGSGSRGVSLLDSYGDCSRQVAKRPGSVLLVRPDGYVGLHCGPEPPIIHAYLEDLAPTRE